VVNGDVDRLPGNILHFGAESVDRLLGKIARNASRRASEWKGQGKRTSRRRTIWRPVRFFFGRYFVREGFRDGFHGLIWWWLISLELLLANYMLLVSQSPKAADERAHP
jgi:hypothetical protein